MIIVSSNMLQRPVDDNNRGVPINFNSSLLVLARNVMYKVNSWTEFSRNIQVNVYGFFGLILSICRLSEITLTSTVSRFACGVPIDCSELCVILPAILRRFKDDLIRAVPENTGALWHSGYLKRRSTLFSNALPAAESEFFPECLTTGANRAIGETIRLVILIFLD